MSRDHATVLIVDDHPSFRATARLVLEAEGFRVVGEAGNAAAALVAVAELRPEFVLLDVQLPDEDGFSVAAQLTRGGDGPCVVMTSSRDGADYGELVASSGACGFIPKSELSGERVRGMLP
jgi:DNA-binding NarL/FixJ family response regulator